MGDKKKNYYEMLGVPRNASIKEIKQAYHKIVRVYHPDAGNGGEIPELKDLDVTHTRIFKTVTLAYDILSDEKLRKEYDATLTPEPAQLKNKAPPPAFGIFGQPGSRNVLEEMEDEMKEVDTGIFSRIGKWFGFK